VVGASKAVGQLKDIHRVGFWYYYRTNVAKMGQNLSVLPLLSMRIRG
jgi:hypothetical protein